MEITRVGNCGNGFRNDLVQPVLVGSGAPTPLALPAGHHLLVADDGRVLALQVVAHGAITEPL